MRHGRTRRTTRALAAMASGAVLFVASAGVASAETVSNKKYATTYCDAIEGWLDQLNEVESEAQTASDGASFQAAAHRPGHPLVAQNAPVERVEAR
jgi:hypothetical protein